MNQIWFYQKKLTIKYDSFYVCAVVLHLKKTHVFAKIQRSYFIQIF